MNLKDREILGFDEKRTDEEGSCGKLSITDVISQTGQRKKWKRQAAAEWDAEFPNVSSDVPEDGGTGWTLILAVQTFQEERREHND